MVRRTRFGARLSAAAVILLLLAVLAPPVAAQPSGCPTPVPIEQVRAGMRGTGYTVVKGGTPERFDVEVLGVQQHWFLPSRHIIIVETSSPAIDKVGGIWFGMSGSPVYLSDGRLLGGLAWGFSLGPSKVAGLTPAQEMLDILEYPPVSSQGSSTEVTAMQGGELSGDVAAQVQQRDLDAGRRMEPLGIPVPVKPRAVDLAQDWFDRAGLPLVAVPAPGSATAAASSFATPRPGANLAGVLSSGARPFYGSGTLTFACDGYAVGFGHPFTAAGPMTMGAADGNAVAVVDDPTLGPWKLMTLAAPYGKLDQDRFAGIRIALGLPAPATPIQSTITDLDFQRSRVATTSALFDRATPFIAAMHLWDAIDDTIDRWGEGTSTVSWTVQGRRESGGAWQLARDNMFASEWDISFSSFWELWWMLEQLQFNPFETVTIDDIAITGALEQDVKRARITEVMVSVDGEEPQPAEGGIFARPGSILDVTAALVGRGYERSVSLSLQVPHDAFGFAFVTVRGGGFSDFFFDEPDGSSGEASSFDELLHQLADQPKGNEVIAEIHTEDGMEPPPEDDWEVFFGQAGGSQDRTSVERVVEGEAFFELFLDGGGFEGVSRVAGSNRVETAVALSQRMFDFGADAVVLSRADTYADALAGGPLAAGLGAPLLLTPTAGLPDVVEEEIARLGAGHAVILGGGSAVSPQVEADLRGAGIQQVSRIAGADRFHTARLIAEQVGGTQVYVAVGIGDDPSRGWPDGLAAGAVGAAQGRPVVLVERDSLPDATRQAVAALGATRATVVGGSAAVSEGVVAALRGLGLEVDRVAGPSRYETAAALARRALAEGLNGNRVWLATGRAFPDALAAGPAVAADGGVLLLVDGQSLDGSPAVRDWLAQYPAEHVVLVGGTAAISPAVEDEIWALAFGGGEVPH